MTIEQEEQRERDRRFMKALGFELEMNVPWPFTRRIRGSVECESGALQSRKRYLRVDSPRTKAEIEIRLQRR